MIKIENIVTPSPEQLAFIIDDIYDALGSIVGKSDSEYVTCGDKIDDFEIGPNDISLIQTMVRAGTISSKFLKMMPIHMRITAPLYWWNDFDIDFGANINNTHTIMHKFEEREFILDDFSTEHLLGGDTPYEYTFNLINDSGANSECCPTEFLKMTCEILNY